MNSDMQTRIENMFKHFKIVYEVRDVVADEMMDYVLQLGIYEKITFDESCDLVDRVMKYRETGVF